MKVVSFQDQPIDLSVVIIARAEQRSLHASIRSAKAAARNLGDAVAVELLVVCMGSEASSHFSGAQLDNVRAICLDNSNEGEARNVGIAQAQGSLIAFLDCGNLMDPLWLKRASHRLNSQEQLAVLHPKYSVNFGASNYVFCHPASSEEGFQPLNLVNLNPWGTTIIAPRSVFERRPFPPCPLGSGFAYPMWHWFRECLADRISVETIEETTAFVRRGTDDLDAPYRSEPWLPHPSDPISIPKGSPLAALDRRGLQVENKTGLREPPPPVAGNRAWLRHLKQRLKTHAPTSWLFNAARWIRRKARKHRSTPFVSLVPQWLIERWREIHALEPALFPESWLLRQGILAPEVHSNPFAAAMADICERIGPECSHLFLLPWLRPSGADLEALNYINAVQENGRTTKIVVLTTENQDSPWRSKLPPNAVFLELARLGGNISESERQDLVARLILHYCPQAVHNINSRTAYEAFCRYGRALKQVSHLYCLSFCLDVTPEGRRVGYPFEYLPRCFDHLEALFSDNRRLLDELHSIYGFDQARLRVHYQPIRRCPPHKRARVWRQEGRLDVLWAGRLDRQKRPDVLTQIAAASEHLPIHFHVFGAAQLDGAGDRFSLKNRCNLTHYGPFSGFDTLPTEECHLFLYTAAWDGLPNAILEAMSCELPVIAPAIGGIPEIVRHGETGILIPSSSDVNGYVNALAEVATGFVDTGSLTARALELIGTQHSWPSFVEHLLDVPGYVSGEANSRTLRTGYKARNESTA